MVDSGTVKQDLSTIQAAFRSYSSETSGLSSWTGPSSESFMKKSSDFATNYLSQIEKGMTAFATACDEYQTYKKNEANYKENMANYNKYANSDNPNERASAGKYKTAANDCENAMKQSESKIKTLLQTAAGTNLEAEATSVEDLATGTITGAASNSVIKAAMDWAIAIAADDSHGYSQATRNGNPNYDCSSLVIAAWEAAGVPVQEQGASVTSNMRSAFTSVGFEWIPGNPNVEDLQPGDVLLAEHSHTEMYVGDGMNVGAHSDYDGANGDSSGKEVNVQAYHGGWDGVLRYSGSTEEKKKDDK